MPIKIKELNLFVHQKVRCKVDNLTIKNENSPLEEKMEEALRNAGIRYKAQYSIEDANKDKWNSKYILDFVVYGEQCKIAIECDGDTYHSSRKAVERDLKRDLWIKAYKDFDDTLRFNTKQIMNQIDVVIEEINKIIKVYDKLHLVKKQNEKFDPKKIPKSISKDNVLILSNILSNAFSLSYSKIQKDETNKEKRKKKIKHEITRLLNKRGFKRIDEYFAYFSLEKLANARHEFDLIFGAFNTPCTLILTSDIKKLKVNKSILYDQSILKVILVYDSSYNYFKGKSYIIINEKSDTKISNDLSEMPRVNEIESSNVILEKYKEINEFEALLSKIKKLEDDLIVSYETLYNLPSFRKSKNVEPFINLEQNQKEKIVYSITQFLRIHFLNESLDKYRSSDITVKWLKEEGMYFQHLKLTFHEITLAIHFLRKQFSQ